MCILPSVPAGDMLMAVWESASQLPPCRPPLKIGAGCQLRHRNALMQSSAKEQQEGQQAEQATATGLIWLAPEKFEAFKRDIIDSLPLSQKDIFTFAINWDSFTNSACASRIQKYISTKVAELLGEEEQTLVAFIMQKLQEHAQASQMLQELVEVLDEDAQEFVLKLYRAVIYETQKCAILGV